MRKLRVAALVASSVVAASATARASGFSIASFGGEHGTPTTTEVTALYYNPSGIADSYGGHLYADANTAWRSASYERPASPTDAPVPAGAEGANTGRASLLNLVFSPFIGASYKFGHLAVGAAFFTPFGGQSSWDKNDHFQGNTTFPGAVDGVSRWWIISGTLASSFFSVGAAYDFGPVSVGLVGNVIQTRVSISQAREPNGDNDVEQEGRSLLDVESWDGSLGVGVTYKALRNALRIGASYQSRPNFGGGIVATGTLKTVFANGALNTNAVDFTTDLPDVFRLGASYALWPDLELRLSGDFQTWSVLDRQCVTVRGSRCDLNPDGSARSGVKVIVNQPRNFHDTFGVRASASYWPRHEIELMAGIGYASNAIPASTYQPDILDANALTFSAGTIVSVLPRLLLGFGYMQLVYLDRDTVGQNAAATLAPPSRAPDAGGRTSILAGVFNVTANYGF
jgi:long-chain fatty acid transport protein